MNPDVLLRFAFVGLGGAIGAMLRYGVTLLVVAKGQHSSLATLTVNVLGAFAIGVAARTIPARQSTEFLLLATGVLGGFTTFSAFALDVFSLAEVSRSVSLAYSGATILLGLLAFYAARLLVPGAG
jgi:CrcB protein